MLFLLFGAACKKHQASAASGIAYSGTAVLSEPRSWLAAAANSWAIMRLSQEREALAAAAAANKLLFAGGAIPKNPGNTSIFYTAIAIVDIFTVSGQ